MSRFVIVGEIKVNKTSKKPTYEKKDTKNGKSIMNTLRLNIKSNNNIFNTMNMGFLKKVPSERKIFAFSKEKGKNNKAELLEIPYNSANNYLDKVAEYSKYIISLEEKEEFLTEYDFIERVNELVENGAFEGKKLKVYGEIEYSKYTDDFGNENIAKKNIIKKIYEVGDSEEEYAESNMHFYFNKNCIIPSETNEDIFEMAVLVNQRDVSLKMDLLYDDLIEINLSKASNPKKAKDVFLKRLNLEDMEDDKLNELALKVEMISGTERVQLTEDMLSDEEKELLEFGFVTLEELQSNYGEGSGAFVHKLVMKSFGRGYTVSGAKITELTEEDFVPKTDSIDDVLDEMTDNMSDDSSEEDLDIFSLEEMDADDVPFL